MFIDHHRWFVCSRFKEHCFEILFVESLKLKFVSIKLYFYNYIFNLYFYKQEERLFFPLLGQFYVNLFVVWVMMCCLVMRSFWNVIIKIKKILV